MKGAKKDWSDRSLKIERLNHDVRGSHDLLIFKSKIFRLIATQKGYLRGGDYHPWDQYCILLSGKGRWTLRRGKKLIRKVQTPYKTIKLPAKVPHMFEAIEDSLMVEWLDNPKFKVEYDASLRKLVTELMEKRSKK